MMNITTSRTSVTATMRVAAAAMAITIFVTACGGGGSSSSGSSPAACTPATLATIKAGKLTIGTDNPAYSPWFAGGSKEGSIWFGPYSNDPANGQGFEGALAYAIAKQLGYAPADVVWVVVAFDQSFAPGAKTFDFDLNQVSITEERKAAVDFSRGYFQINQAVIALASSTFAKAATLAELAGAHFGTMAGTTSLDAITNVIKPTAAVKTYATMDAAVAALNARQIDALVADLPTAFYLRDSGQVDDGVIVGQLASAGGAPEEFGAVLAKGSPLTGCVNTAIDALQADGTLESLRVTWLTDKANAPVLK